MNVFSQKSKAAMKRTAWYVNVSLVILALLCVLLAACGSSITITVGQPEATGTVQPVSPAPGGTLTLTPVTPGPHPNAQERQIAQSVFDAINKDRAAAGLAQLQWSDALAMGARQHDFAMMGANQLSHQLPGEAGLGDREKQQGVQWQQAAENVGYTTDISENGALSLHKAMMAEKPPEDGHLRNILDTQNNRLGVDILFDSTHGRLWLTEDFAKSG
jgi:uncharacterized protein YkwD